MAPIADLSRHVGWAVVMAVAVASIAPVGCDRGSSDNGGTPTVRVGSKDFPEQFILGELMAQLIEAHTDLPVKRVFNLGGTMVCHNALANGDIDVYAEYTGTGLVAVLKKPVIAEPDKAYRAVADAYDKQFDCRWLEPFGFNNTYAITVRNAEAAEKGWTKVSDLAGAAGDLKAGFTHEFMGREDGYPGLKSAYGLTFADTKALAPTLMYEAVANGQVDVICAFATDGRIAAYKLRPLLDDKGFFPPYYAAPVVRADILSKHPEVGEALNRLAGRLDDATMQRLNYQVDEHKRAPADVAREFLTSEGLLAATQPAAAKAD